MKPPPAIESPTSLKNSAEAGEDTTPSNAPNSPHRIRVREIVSLESVVLRKLQGTRCIRSRMHSKVDFP